MKLERYEHNAMTIETAGSKIAIDFGCFSPAETIAKIGKIDSVLVSHKHPDHFFKDHIEIFAAPVYGPKDVIDLLNSETIGHVVACGQSIALAPDLRVTTVHADHGPKVSAPVENFGFVIESAGRRVYYVGDVAIAGAGPAGPFDLVCIPVAGGGFVFDAEAAVSYIVQLGHKGKVMPIHDGGPAQANCLQSFADLAKDTCEVVLLNPFDWIEV